jgi:transposase
MNDVLHAAADLATPLIERLRVRIAALPIVLADETSMRMQLQRKRGFVWVDDVGGGELVLYIFVTDRSGQTPAQLLGGTRGILVVDEYTGYNNVTDPEGRARAGCWCHLRRKLFEARTAVGDDADIGIGKLRPLFRVEHEATAIEIVGTAEHLELRTQRSKPVVDDFFQWAATLRASVLPKSPLGEALGYAINQRARLELFLTDAGSQSTTIALSVGCELSPWEGRTTFCRPRARRQKHRQSVLARRQLHRKRRRAHRVSD